MNIQSWTLEKDDSIQCQQLTSEYLEDALNMMEYAFFRHENVCKALGIPEDTKALAELKELTRTVAKDGVTIIAIDKKKNKVVGAAFNKLQVKGAPGETSFFEDFANSFKDPRTQAILQLMMDIDNICNLFEYCKTDCILEIMFLGTLPEYRGKGIAKKICEVSIELGRKLLHENNVKVSIDGQKLNLHPVPKIASAIFTSFITQKIGRQLDFQTVAEKSYEVLEFNGKSYASVIGNETRSLTLAFKRLD